MPTARLGIALSQTGSRIEAVCPASHIIRESRILQKAYTYKALSPLLSFRDAISGSLPDLIVSADDLSTQHLIDLHAQEKRQDSSGTAVCELIERSLGPEESFRFMTARAAFMNIASQEGIRIPQTAVIRDARDLETLISETGFPIVLKADGSSSGEGTRVVRTHLQAERALQSLQRPPHLIRVVKRVLVNHDLRSVPPKLESRRAVVNAQKYIPGRDATSLVACWRGTILGALHFEVVEKQHAFGPASVMRLIEKPEIELFVSKVVRRLKLSGLHGFDFLLEDRTDLPYMIELNPRATQVGHLTLGPGRDLPGALYAAVTGTAVRNAPKLTDNPTIALFPQESMRDSQSSYLLAGYHDIPTQEPELIRACLRRAQKWPTQKFWEACSRIFSTNRSSL
jgi:glutathione synthase/RimK-type ligase-like ATP-grasp enzyme